LDKAQLLRTVEKEGIEFINLMYVDLFGRTRSMLLRGSKLSSQLESVLGTGFDGSSGGLGLVIENSDAFLKADTSTFTFLPWEGRKTAVLLCDVYGPNGAPLQSCPRSILRRSIDQMKVELGQDIEAILGPEMEWYYLRMVDGKLSVADEGGYMSPPSSDGAALGIADAIVLYKIAVKSLARSHGLIVTFMPKPYSERAGTGMHVHLSLADSRSGTNLFSDVKSEHGLSKCALHFIGGLLEHAKALAAIVTPSVNSYKRLVPVPRFEAPVYLAWGVYNRSALIRIPPSPPESTRIEYRPVDASCNPYLAFACIVAAGMDGVKRKVTPPSPVQENVYHMSAEDRRKKSIDRLPSSLGEALDELQKDTLIRKVLGDQVAERYLATKRDEWLDYCTLVTDWEKERYLDI
jgi:glutamine synthetase